MSCLKLLNKQSSIRPLRSQYQDLNIIMSENKKSPQIVATFAGKKSLKHFLIKYSSKYYITKSPFISYTTL